VTVSHRHPSVTTTAEEEQRTAASRMGSPLAVVVFRGRYHRGQRVAFDKKEVFTTAEVAAVKSSEITKLTEDTRPSGSGFTACCYRYPITGKEAPPSYRTPCPFRGWDDLRTHHRRFGLLQLGQG